MTNKLLEIKDLSFSYTSKPFIENLSMDIERGQVLSLVGENGSGKSTLVQLINGLLKPLSGEILYSGKPLNKLKYRDRAKETAVVYQGFDCGFPFNCFQVAAMGLFPYRTGFGELKADEVEDIKKCMSITNTLSMADRPINSLSGGEIQRVLLAKALVQKPKLLILDEAMSALDIAAKTETAKFLKKYAETENIGVLIVQHDLNLAFSYSHKIAALKDGKIVFNGTPKQLLTEEFFRQVFNVTAEIYEDKFFITDCVKSN